MAKKAAPAVDPKNQLNLRESDYLGKSRERIEAESAQSPIHSNTQTARLFSQGTFGVADLTHSADTLAEKVQRVQGGDLSEAEAILMSQATALNAIFTEMARRAALNMGEYVNAAETYMRMALKAQSQCRTTLEALAEIKTPRHVSFVKQANIAHGPQQVNNGGETLAHGNNSIPSNELSGAAHGLLPDARASQIESRIDTPVEALGEVHRAAHGCGQGYQCSQ